MTATPLESERAARAAPGLLIQAQSGSREALAELVDRHAPMVSAVVRAYLGPGASEADDLIQETLVRACERIRQCRREEALPAWLSRIARNVCRDHLGSTWRSRVTLRETDEGCGTAGADADAAIVIRRALGQLPREQRMVLLLRYAHGLSFEEMGTALGGGAEAARSRVRRALGRMARLLGPDWEEDLP